MGKTVSYILLAITAIVGLGSAYQMHRVTGVVAEANSGIAQHYAELDKQAKERDNYDYYASEEGAQDPKPDKDLGEPDAE